MPKILFVDDDVNVLNGLQRMLRVMRNEWQIAFADNGREALATLGREPFDIVVTDMRMPSMNGAELLAEVLQLHPQVVRIILSGQADLQNALAGIGLAHQYLSKPTEPTVLIGVLKRVIGLLAQIPNPALRRSLNSLQSLPSAPHAYSQLIELVRTPGCDADSLAEIVASDMGLAAKTLQTAGSAFANSPCRGANVWQAVQILGPDLIRSLAIDTGVFTDLSQLDGAADRALISELLASSSQRARCAAADTARSEAAAESATFELLRDVGQVALAVALGAEHSAIHSACVECGSAQADAESSRVGVCHRRAGSYLMGIWGLPETLTEAIANASFPISSSPLPVFNNQGSDARHNFAEISR